MVGEKMYSCSIIHFFIIFFFNQLLIILRSLITHIYSCNRFNYTNLPFISTETDKNRVQNVSLPKSHAHPGASGRTRRSGGDCRATTELCGVLRRPEHRRLSKLRWGEELLQQLCQVQLRPAHATLFVVLGRSRLCWQHWLRW